MGMDKVHWCVICDEFYAESRIDVKTHAMEDHSLDERLNALLSKGQEPEDTHK